MSTLYRRHLIRSFHPGHPGHHRGGVPPGVPTRWIPSRRKGIGKDSRHWVEGLGRTVLGGPTRRKGSTIHLSRRQPDRRMRNKLIRTNGWENQMVWWNWTVESHVEPRTRKTDKESAGCRQPKNKPSNDARMKRPFLNINRRGIWLPRTLAILSTWFDRKTLVSTVSLVTMYCRGLRAGNRSLTSHTVWSKAVRRLTFEMPVFIGKINRTEKNRR